MPMWAWLVTTNQALVIDASTYPRTLTKFDNSTILEMYRTNVCPLISGRSGPARNRNRSYLSNLANWQQSGKKKGQPGLPGASDHPTLYEGTCSLDLDQLDQRQNFVRLKVYTGESWTWANYPVSSSRYFEQRRTDPSWELQ